MKTWQRKEIKFAVKSLNLNCPIDLVPDGDVPYLNNLRINRQGQPEPRQGISAHASCADPIHSIKRLNNESPGNPGPAWTRIVGAGTKLYTGDTTLTSIDTSYSGNPLSFAVMNQDVAQFPFCYVGDSNKNVKVDVSSNLYNMGIREPKLPPSAVLGAAGLVNVGTGTPYVYAFTFSNSKTGATSNPSPIIRASSGVSPVNQKVVVTVAFTGADAQVDTVTIFRMGGSIATFRRVGSLPVPSPASFTGTFTDNNPDLSIETALPMDTDNFVPFVSVDLTRTGTCDVSTNVVTWDSGDTFNTNWPNNTIIVINGQPYTGYGPPLSTTSWNILEDGGTQTGVPFQVIQPEIIAAPLEFLWGPYGGGFTGQVIFGCGDARRPGSIYWTKGNNPDSNPENNRLDITSGSESLQNGCLFDGNPFVFSTERIFRLYPDLTVAGNYYALEVPNSKGLFARWAMAVGPQAIYFLAQDGIYMTNGGAPVSISDEKLRPLFSREGGNGETVNEIPAPDMTQETALRLSVVGNILYFDYIGTDATPHTLLYDLVENFWLHDTLNCCSSTEKQVVSRYQDEGQNANQEFIGTAAHLAVVGGSTTDFGGTLNCELLTASIDLGDPRFEKLYGDAMVDIDPGGGVSALVRCDDNTRVVGTYSLPTTGREQFILDILDPANTEGNFAVYGKNISLYLSWFTGEPVSLYGWSFTYEAKSEVSVLRPTDQSDEGFVGDKRFYGVVLKANTYGVTRTVQIWADGANTGVTLSVNHAGELEKPYAFAPFVCHELKLFPVDANDWELFEASIRWLFDEYPENSFLQKDFTDQGKPGAKYFRQLLVEGDTGGVNVGVQVWADGVLNQTITANQYGKSEVAYSLVPFVANEVRTVPLGLIRNFAEHWTFDPYPDLAATYTAITDQGKPGAKYFRELLLEFDTAGASTGLRIYADGVLNQTVTVSANGKSEVPIAVVPFLANEIQLQPLGPMRIFSQNWTFDNYPDFAAVTTEWDNAGVIGAKYIYGIIIEADTAGAAVTVAIQSDAEIGFTAFNIVATHDGRSEKPYAFAPIVAHLFRLVPSAPWAMFRYKLMFDPWPEYAAFIPDFSDLGVQGEKFYQGFILTADTDGEVVNLAMLDDGGTLQGIVPVNHAGKQERPYSFTPYVGHQLKLVPDAPLRFFAIRWVWEPSPELASNWITQLTSHGQRGFFHERDIYVALQSTADVTLLMTFDLGNSTVGTRTYTIPSTAGVFLKQYLVLAAVKGKLVSYSFTSSQPFRLFVKDCEVRLKPWGSDEAYQVLKPFGGESMAVGAAI